MVVINLSDNFNKIAVYLNADKVILLIAALLFLHMIMGPRCTYSYQFSIVNYNEIMIPICSVVK